MKHLTLALLLFFAMGASARNDIEKEMLETFVKYASIDSQSNVDSVCTAGQHDMALALKADIDQAVRESGGKNVKCLISPENYLYVIIPSNVNQNCPRIGISCHLDVTPEAQGGRINPVVDKKDGRVIVRTDGSTLLGADDKCGCTIAVQLIRTILRDRNLRHGKVMFAFCPNEDVGRAAEGIDASVFSPDILFDLDGPGGDVITDSNFTARGFNVRFIGRDAHPGDAKEQRLGDATAAAAAFISYFPVESRPENSEGKQGYIHPWSFDRDGVDVTVQTRVRYFDKAEGQLFDRLLKGAVEEVALKFPNVRTEILYDDLQYENVEYTLHPQARTLVEKAAANTGKKVTFASERGGTTASMFAARGFNGGMCVFTGQHDIHSTREYADLQEMEEAYRLMMEIIKLIPSL